MRHVADIFETFGKSENFNLHNHTVYSDGSHTPEELMIEARQKLITVLSITDHDTLGAYIKGNALDIAKKEAIHLIPGFEATVKDHKIHGYTSHMLMYFHERLLTDQAFLKDFGDTIGQARTKSVLEFRLLRLNQEFGLDLSLEDFFSQTIDGEFSNINSYIIKNVIRVKYPFFSKPQIDFMLSDDSPANVDIGTTLNDLSYLRFKYDILAVLAHPMLKRNAQDVKMNTLTLAYIHKLTQNGTIDGLELFHPDVTNEARITLRQFHHILYTAGSDTHNKIGSRPMFHTGISQVINPDFEMLNKKANTAVMVGRLNPPHIGHIRVINKALAESDTLVMFLGSANVINEKNPFSFEERKSFLETLFEKQISSGKLIISFLDDVGNDALWTANLGEKVKSLVSDFDGTLNFYGGDFQEDRAISAVRDNESQLGVEKVLYTQVSREHFTLPDGQDISATNLRKALASGDFEAAKNFLLPKIAQPVIEAWKSKTK